MSYQIDDNKKIEKALKTHSGSNSAVAPTHNIVSKPDVDQAGPTHSPLLNSHELASVLGTTAG